MLAILFLFHFMQNKIISLAESRINWLETCEIMRIINVKEDNELCIIYLQNLLRLLRIFVTVGHGSESLVVCAMNSS